MPARIPNANSRYRQRLELRQEPDYLALQDRLVEARAQIGRLRRDLWSQRQRAELWKHRALDVERRARR